MHSYNSCLKHDTGLLWLRWNVFVGVRVGELSVTLGGGVCMCVGGWGWLGGGCSANVDQLWR